MSESVVAGRLEIEVEADTKGFGERLKAVIEKETRNLVAKVGLEVDEDGFKQRLEAAVEKAARGVEAKIETKVDTKKAKAELEKLGAKVNLKVESIRDDLEKQSLWARAFARKNKITFPVDVDRKGFFSSLLAMRVAGNAAAKKTPIKIPFVGDEKSLRSAVMPMLVLAIASIIQPAIAAIVGALGGAAAMVSNLAMSVQTLAAAPTVLIGLVGGLMLANQAFAALGGEIADTNKTVGAAKKDYDALMKTWAEGQDKAAIAFWKQVNGELGKAGKSVLPVVNKGFEQLSGSMGQTFRDLLQWARSDVGKGQIGQILSDAAISARSMGKGLLGVVKGLTNIATAAGLSVGGKDSLLVRMNRVFEKAGDWASKIAKPGKAAKEFASDLSYAADKAGQLWDMLVDLGGGIAGVARAARGTGDRLLGKFGDFLDRWHKWVDSSEGQSAITKWFKDVEPIAVEAGKLIADIGKAIIRMAADPNVATMLKRIREDVLPTLEKFLTNLGKSLGPEVIDFFTNLIDVLAELSAAGGPLATGLGYINDALSKVGNFLRENPDMAARLGTILGALLAFRSLAILANIAGIPTLFNALGTALKGLGVGGLLGLTAAILPFTGALGDMNPVLQGAVAAFGTFLLLRSQLPAMQGILRGLAGSWDSVRLAVMIAADNYRTAVGKFGGETGKAGIGAAARAVGTTAKQGLRGALAGLGASIGMGAAGGGPIGAAIGIVTGLVGIWATKHAEASQKAQEYKAFVDQIVESLDKESGALTESTKAAVAKRLQDEGSAAAAQKYGVNLADLTNAALGNADAQSRVGSALRANIAQTALATDSTGLFKQALSDAGITQQQLESALFNGGAELATLTGRLDGATKGNVAMQGAINRAINAGVNQTKGQRELHNSVASTSNAVKDASAKQSVFNQLMDKAGAEVRDVTSALSKLPPGKTTTVKALTKDAEAKLIAMGYKVTHLPDGTVQVSASTAAAERAINYAARNRTAHIQVSYSGAGKNLAGGLTKEADGGVLSFFRDGGISDMVRNGVRAFANGTENHVAQIAKAGTWRLWAEPETGGEAYIPLSPAKRGRSLAILKEVADRFGMVVAPKFTALAAAMEGGRGGFGPTLQAFAGGGLRSSDLTSASSRPTFIFQPGAISVTNPAPEPASKSISDQLRSVTEFGLFDE